jgi:hypothetical protein
MKSINAYYRTWEDTRSDFNQLSAFIGSNIQGTETEFKYLSIPPDHPDLARHAYEGLLGSKLCIRIY